MPGAVLLALSSFALLFGSQEELPGDSPGSWVGLPRIQGDGVVPLGGSPAGWDLKGAKGLSVVESVSLPPGRPLAVASSRAGETWVLLDQPLPGLPGADPETNKPVLVRFSREGGAWQVKGQFPAPVGALTLAANEDALVLGTPEGVWLIPARNPGTRRKILAAIVGNRDIPVPSLDELGNILVALGPGRWQIQEWPEAAEIPGGGWGILGLSLDQKKSLVWATGMAPVSGWLSSSGEGELFTADREDGITHLRLLRAGNDAGFRCGTRGNPLEAFKTVGIGAIPSLLARDGLAATCGLALGASLGPDWKGRLLVGQKGRLVALSTTAPNVPTRNLVGRLDMLEANPSRFLPVGLAEEKGGDGLWVLVSPRDFKAEGTLPLETVPCGNLLLVQDQAGRDKRGAISGPLTLDPTVREELDQVPSGPARDSRARELAKSDTGRIGQLAQLCLDPAVEGKIRQSAWFGLVASGQAGSHLHQVLATDHPGIKASACRYCCFLRNLPQDASGPLLDCLQDPDETVVREAACAAGLHHLPGAAESLGAILFQRDEADLQTQSGALFGLGRLGGEGADKMLSAAQTGVRAEAVRALKARVGYPWPVGLGGKAEVWLDHPHLGPEHLALYFEGLLAWKGWQGTSGGKTREPVELTIAEALAWLETHPDQQAEVLEAGLKLSASLPLERAPIDWWRSMIREQKGKVCALALGNISRLKLPAWAGEILVELEREDLSSAERLAGMRLMRAWGQSVAAIRLAVPLLEPGVIPGQDPAVTREALDCLQEYDPVRGREAAFRVIQSPRAIPGPMAKAARILAGEEESRVVINQSFVEGNSAKYPFLSWNVWVDALAQAGAGKDLDLTLVSNWLGSQSARVRLRESVEKQGNPRTGLFVFLNRERAQCLQCHSIGGSGGGVGPALNPGMAPEMVLESMVRPGSRIHPDFPLVSGTGPDGQQFSGVLLRAFSQAGKSWVVATQGGRTILLPKKDGNTPRSVPGSLMQSIGEKRLTYQEVLDLLAFLSTARGQKELGALVGLVVEANQAEGDLPGGTPFISNSLGQFEVGEGKRKLGLFVRSNQPGSARIQLVGGKLGADQTNSISVTSEWQQLIVEVEVPPGATKKTIALRLFGPQGIVIGAFPR